MKDINNIYNFDVLEIIEDEDNNKIYKVFDQDIDFINANLGWD